MDEQHVVRLRLDVVPAELVDHGDRVGHATHDDQIVSRGLLDAAEHVVDDQAVLRRQAEPPCDEVDRAASDDHLVGAIGERFGVVGAELNPVVPRGHGHIGHLGAFRR